MSGAPEVQKLSAFSPAEKVKLYCSIKTTPEAMLKGGGRNTEIDLYENRGGYKTILSKNTSGKPCPLCGAPIKKENYLGGSIYFCSNCQSP
jgi:formamidopyrimidine-DNA glycosylase